MTIGEQMNIDDFLASHPYTDETKRTYRAILERVFKPCADPASLSAVGLLTIIQSVGWGNARQCMALAASQKYLAWRFGQLHPALYAKLKRIKGRPQRALTAIQAGDLLASFNTFTAKGSRDLAIASLAMDTGLRCSELCRLQQADTDTSRRVLQVIVKGGQWAAAVFGDETAARIERWKDYRQSLSPKGFLFVNIYTGDGLTPEGLLNIMRVWGQKIDIILSPHDLRRTFAVLATENGAPERVLMEGGRWHNSEMITQYTRTLKLEAMRRYLPVKMLK
jgi:integrase